MYYLNFTLISFLSRIGNRGKPFFKEGLEEAFILFHAPPPHLRASILSIAAKF
jgi:hypothetical protein